MIIISTTELRLRRSKKPRLPGPDFISNIPDDVLTHILSSLPLEDAVRTSILSNEWNHKWTTSLSKLDIHTRHWQADHPSFVSFLNRTIPSLEFLKVFQVCCAEPEIRREQANDVERWFSAALKHNLEIFNVVFEPLNHYIVVLDHSVVLPSDLLNSSTCLRQFRLRCLHSTWNAAAKNIAPKLTNLHLGHVAIVSGSPTMTFTFPVLETLKIEGCEWMNIISVEIHAPSLTALSSSGKYEVYNYSFVVFAPRLAIFHTIDIPQRIILEQSSVVREFHSCGFSGNSPDPDDLGGVTGLRVRNLLSQFTNLEEVFLHGNMIKNSTVPLGQLKKLRRLAFTPVTASLLIELLHAAPSLESLAVEVDCRFRGNYDYGALQSIPACLGSHLEEVVITGFGTNDKYYNLAEFLLKNAKQLRKFRIAAYEYYDIRKVEYRLSDVVAGFSSSPTISVERSHADDLFIPKEIDERVNS